MPARTTTSVVHGLAVSVSKTAAEANAREFEGVADPSSGFSPEDSPTWACESA